MQGQRRQQRRSEERVTSNLADPDADPIENLPLARAEDDDDIAGRPGSRPARKKKRTGMRGFQSQPPSLGRGSSLKPLLSAL